MNKLACFVFFILAAVNTNAHALEVGVEGGLNFWSAPTTFSVTAPATATNANSPSAEFMGGAFASFGIMPLFDLEAGIYYANKKNTQTSNITVSGSTTSTVSVNTASSYLFPVLLRTNFLPFVNAGAGVYYEAGTGNVTSNGVSESYSAAGLKQSDFGLLVSGQVKLPIAPLIHVLLDARYLLGLTEQSTNSASYSTKNRYVQLMGGVTFGF